MSPGKKARILLNGLRAFASYRLGKSRLGHLPSYLWIEPTNHCNLKCIMCPSGAGRVRAERGDMDPALFRQIIDEIHPWASTIILAMGGESLLHPGLSDMIRTAEGRGIKVHLNTNATLLDENKTEELLAAGISSISFAFDGFGKGPYERARRGADFGLTVGRILHFLRRRKETRRKKPYAVLSILDLGRDDSSPEDKGKFLRAFDGLIDDVHVRSPNSWGPVFLECPDFRFDTFDRPSGPCGRLWNTLGLAWNGDVLPCSFDMNHDYVLGRLGRTTVAEAWNGPAMVALRKAWLEGRPLDLLPLCRNCTVAGSPRILGVPAGLRASLADGLTNVFGYGLERKAIRFANLMRRGRFTARPVRDGAAAWTSLEDSR